RFLDRHGELALRDGSRADADRAVDHDGTGPRVHNHARRRVGTHNVEILDERDEPHAVVPAAAGADRYARAVDHRRSAWSERAIDRVGDALRIGCVELMKVEDQPVAIGKAGIDRALDRRAVRDAAARGHVDRQFRPVGRVDAESPDDEVALCHRINLSVGTIERRENERPAAQALCLADRRDSDVEPLTGLCERGQLGGNHDRGCVLERRIDPWRQRKTEARNCALHSERRIIEAVVARARKPDDDAVPGKLVRTHALELAHILDPRRRGGGGQAEARDEEGEKGEQEGTLGHDISPRKPQKGLMMEKKRCSQPWRLARAISPLPTYRILASATRVDATRLSGLMSTARISPEIWTRSSPRLRVSSFSPFTSIVPLG